ncbi:hypothetical protein GTCCBUS3UF5_21620 [Geobacillus thermoleovorans CCB_US3_UF5]|uniref:Uncharacterized protein n=1 Tax=Geobacillus thermoleovorans CCB_US3_UF5 TaxID=1111068 RepID=A0ABM5MIN7_GEOTH|nr:hypothetical protein GTCCBUS3UF5_21620 [Geobacillus thermoleovorans CCB_US3_UF5]GAJ58778.1 hypothetical protein B23_1990 [Geobacillus thermoleovorans B23]
MAAFYFFIRQESGFACACHHAARFLCGLVSLLLGENQ